jgi:hypothetical protein
MPKKSVTDETVQIMIQMAKGQHTLREISDTVGHAPSCVYNKLKKAGVSLSRTKKTGSKEPTTSETPTEPASESASPSS